MELSPNVVKGLNLLGNTCSINDECFSHILADTITMITDVHKVPFQSQIQSDGGKESYAALMSFFLEAARCDVDASRLSAQMDSLNFPSQRKNKVVAAYQKYKSKIQALLSNIGMHPAHIVDADWKLDYCVQSNSISSVGDLMFLIQLQTESSGLTLNSFEKVKESVKFTCSVEQLQDLVVKLKEAVKQVERIAHT